MVSDGQPNESARIEALWGGQFGDDYLARNPATPHARLPFWSTLLARIPDASSFLEVGCNLGANLRPIRQARGDARLTGIDINADALRALSQSGNRLGLARAAARRLPFADGSFDLAFTCGVLIHQPPETLKGVMQEVTRCARRYVFCAEYFAKDWTEVPYRNQERALFKGDFGKEYQRLFPELRLLETGFLSKAESWGDVTFWLFQKDSAALEGGRS